MSWDIRDEEWLQSPSAAPAEQPIDDIDQRLVTAIEREHPWPPSGPAVPARLPPPPAFEGDSAATSYESGKFLAEPEQAQGPEEEVFPETGAETGVETGVEVDAEGFVEVEAELFVEAEAELLAEADAVAEAPAEPVVEAGVAEAQLEASEGFHIPALAVGAGARESVPASVQAVSSEHSAATSGEFVIPTLRHSEAPTGQPPTSGVIVDQLDDAHLVEELDEAHVVEDIEDIEELGGQLVEVEAAPVRTGETVIARAPEPGPEDLARMEAEAAARSAAEAEPQAAPFVTDTSPSLAALVYDDDDELEADAGGSAEAVQAVDSAELEVIHEPEDAAVWPPPADPEADTVVDAVAVSSGAEESESPPDVHGVAIEPAEHATPEVAGGLVIPMLTRPGETQPGEPQPDEPLGEPPRADEHHHLDEVEVLAEVEVFADIDAETAEELDPSEAVELEVEVEVEPASHAAQHVELLTHPEPEPEPELAAELGADGRLELHAQLETDDDASEAHEQLIVGEELPEELAEELPEELAEELAEELDADEALELHEDIEEVDDALELHETVDETVEVEAVELPAEASSPSAEESRPPIPPEAKLGQRRKSWHDDAFAEHFLFLYPPTWEETARRDAAFIVESLGLDEPATILDVGCGEGRHAIELGKLGHRVTGVDNSLALLLSAAQSKEVAGLEDARVEFLHADMRRLPGDREFDVVVCLGSTLGYFEDEQNWQCIAEMRGRLKPGGRLLIHVFNRDFVVPQLPARSWWQGKRCNVLDEAEMNFYASRLRVHRTVVFDDGRQYEHFMSMRAYTVQDLGKALSQMGLRVTEVSGSRETRGRFYGSASPDIWIVAERKA